MELLASVDALRWIAGNGPRLLADQRLRGSTSSRCAASARTW